MLTDVPRCSQTKTEYGVAINQQVDINCEVTAHPTNVFYEWYFNQSMPIADANSFNRFSKGGFFSFTPKHRFDYGNLSCGAYNAVGHMKGFCTYMLMPSNRPDPVNFCIAEQSEWSSSKETVLEKKNWAITTTTSAIANYSDIEVDNKVEPKDVHFTVICKFPYNGGEEDSTFCTAEITHLNDSRPFWSGESSSVTLLSDGLTYQCAFQPPVKAHLQSQYRFSITSLNKIGPAEQMFNFSGHVRPRTSLPKVVTQKRGSADAHNSKDNENDDDVVKWENFIGINTNISIDGVIANNTKASINKKEKFWKDVKTILNRSSTYVYLFFFVIVIFATYKLTIVSVHAHELRVARAQIYASTSEEGNGKSYLFDCLL